MSDPWQEGFHAHMRGDEKTSNPYSPESKGWPRWLAGWTDREEHCIARDVALDSIGWFGPPSDRQG